jgi:hypothetical protein
MKVPFAVCYLNAIEARKDLVSGFILIHHHQRRRKLSGGLLQHLVKLGQSGR